MERLSEVNLFHSHFIIGTHKNKNKNLIYVKALNNWLEHKDSDWGMKDFKSKRTQYVGFLDMIDTPKLQLIFLDLVSIYRRSFPYANKQDFLNYIFGFTLFDLERFNTREFRYLGSPPNDIQFEFYYCFDFGEIIDFAVPQDSSIEQYKQYFRKIVDLIHTIPWVEEGKNNEFSENKYKIELTTVKEKNNFSALEWATIFYYADEANLLSNAKNKIERLEQFIDHHHITTTLQNLKVKYYEAQKRIYKKNDFPVDKLESIIPFLEKNYPSTVTKVEGDIEFLKEENPEY